MSDENPKCLAKSKCLDLDFMLISVAYFYGFLTGLDILCCKWHFILPSNSVILTGLFTKTRPVYNISYDFSRVIWFYKTSVHFQGLWTLGVDRKPPRNFSFFMWVHLYLGSGDWMRRCGIDLCCLLIHVQYISTAVAIIKYRHLSLPLFFNSWILVSIITLHCFRGTLLNNSNKSVFFNWVQRICARQKDSISFDWAIMRDKSQGWIYFIWFIELTFLPALLRH